MIQLKQNNRWKRLILLKKFANPLTPMSDQDRVSSYKSNIILTRKVTRIYQNIKWRILADLIPSSPNSHHKNCLPDNKENY